MCSIMGYCGKIDIRNFNLTEIPQYLYFGNRLPCELPEGLTIRTLSYNDRKHIAKWAGEVNGEHTQNWKLTRPESFVNALLNEMIYKDEAFTVYGAFMNEKLCISRRNPAKCSCPQTRIIKGFKGIYLN